MKDFLNENFEKVDFKMQKPIAMTIQKFSFLILKNPEYWKNIGLIVIDEVDYLLNLQQMEKNNGKENITILKNLLIENCNNIHIVGISATGIDKIYNFFGKSNINKINTEKLPKQNQIITKSFTNWEIELKNYLKTKPKNEKFAFYSKHINTLIKAENIIKQNSNLKTVILFSENNENYKMNKKSLEIRNSLINSKEQNLEIDCILYNEANQRAINILDKNFQTIIINDSNQTNIIQARGRFRFEIRQLLFLSKESKVFTINLPKKWLKIPLTKKDIEIMEKELNLDLKTIEKHGYRTSKRKIGGNLTRTIFTHYSTLENRLE